MMNKIYKHVLVASLLMMGGTAMAQTLNSAYFTDDYNFRHDMNPAFENMQNYITIPALGNINVNLQGNFGYKDVVLNNPMYGQDIRQTLKHLIIRNTQLVQFLNIVFLYS